MPAEVILLETKIPDLLSKNKIPFVKIEHVQSNKGIDIFNIDNKYLLRLFNTEFANELKNIKRIAHLPKVPQIRYCSETENNEDKFIILDYIQGNELYSSLPNISEKTQKEIALKLFEFLQQLYQLKNTTYDIGHYIPIIPDYYGSWREGHQEYQEQIKKKIVGIPLLENTRALIKKTFKYFSENIDSLEFQFGPTLLHNDLHPKNIIVEDGDFSGIIDWECSQFGEPDFDLCHVIHWCLFPPNADINMTAFTRTLLHAFSQFYQIPDLPIRLTIYQLEHELQKMIWENGSNEREKCSRIESWLGGEIFEFI